MSDMLRPTMKMARARLSGLIAIGCAVAGGAAMVTAAGVVGESGIRSHPPVTRLAEADLTVSAKQVLEQEEDIDLDLPERETVDSGLAEIVAQVPGVSATAGEVGFDAAVLDSKGQPIGDPDNFGHGWQIIELGGIGVDGTAPEGPGQAAVDTATAHAAGIEVGDSFDTVVSGAPQRFDLTAVADGAGTGIFVADTEALGFAGRQDGPQAGRSDLVAATVADGSDVEEVAERVAAAVGSDLVVSTGADIGDVESPGSGTGELIALSASLAGTIIMIVGFIVAGAVSVSAAGQRRELALLRAVGATPRQVRRLIATQSSVAAAIGVLPGAAIGYLLAAQFSRLLAEAGAVSGSLELTWSPFPAVIAIVLLLATVQLAARTAAHRLSRIDPTEAITEAVVEPREPSRTRLMIGYPLIALALATGVTPLFLHNEAGFVSAATAILPAMIGLSLAAPSLVREVTGRLARRLNPRGSVATWLAVHNSHGYALRMAGAVSVLALAAGFMITQVFSQTTLAATIDEELAAGATVDATVTGATGVTETDRKALGQLPEVSAAVGVFHTAVFIPYEENGKPRATEYPALAVSGTLDSVIDPNVETGDLANLTGNAVALDSATAGWENVAVGDRITLVLANGSTVKPQVVATYQRGFGFGKVLASADLVTAASGTRPYDSVLLATDRDEPVAEWAASRQGMSVSDGGGAAGLAEGAGLSPDQWISLVASLALLGYVLLGVGNSLVAATTRRRGELAMLRLIGATPTQLLAMMRREAAIMAALAVGAAGVLSLLPMSLLGLGFVGRPWPQGPLWLIPAIAVLVSGLAYLATMVPTRRSLAVAPMSAISRAD